MERADRVLMVQSPNGIARIPLTMRGTIHGGIDDEGIVQAAAVQTILLPMRVTARGINDVLITMTVRADIGTDTDRPPPRALLIRHLAPKRCRRGWMSGIDPLDLEPPVSPRWRRTAPVIEGSV